MRKAITSSLYIALLIATFCSALTTAHAGTVVNYNDSLECLNSCPSNGFGPPAQPIVNFDVTGYFIGSSLGPPDGVISVVATLDLSATVSNFFEQSYCSPYCTYFWGGDFSQGSVTIDALLFNGSSTRDIQFTGLINSGSFNTSYTENNCGDCPFGLEYIDFAFSGQWSNGWQSTGGVNVENAYGGNGGGTLVLNTQTPEPASLMLFGSGVLGLAGMLRRRLGR
jgi:PEP-CTERM motif